MGACQSYLGISLQKGNQTEDGNYNQELPLPHKCLEILGADPPVDISLKSKLYDQLSAGVFLDEKKQKYWVEKESRKNCFMLFAKALKIEGSNDTAAFKWDTEGSGAETFTVAELQNVPKLEISGKFDTDKLSPTTWYEVVFVVKLLESDRAFGWEDPVNVKLSLPDASKHVPPPVKMEDQKREKWIEIPVGVIKTSADQRGVMEFSMTGHGKNKGGLVVKGVEIRPKQGRMKRPSFKLHICYSKSDQTD